MDVKFFKPEDFSNIFNDVPPIEERETLLGNIVNVANKKLEIEGQRVGANVSILNSDGSGIRILVPEWTTLIDSPYYTHQALLICIEPI